MKIGVVGSGGYIAGNLMLRLAQSPHITELAGFDKIRDERTVFIDLEQPKAINLSVFDGIDLLIFTAAVSSPDLCARQYDQCYTINVTGTSQVIRHVLARGVKVLFFSSDAVFGTDGGVFDEKSETRAVTPYGRMKKAVEDTFCGDPGFLAIRLSYVASSHDRFTSYCMDCLNNDKEVEIFHPFYRSCITLKDVCDAVSWICGHWGRLPASVLNLAGAELVSRVRMADEINRVYGGRLRYRVAFPPPSFFENRPKITQMRSLYLYDLGMIKQASFTEKYRKELEDLTR